ncbi:MAG TPA: DUF4124 domain-containing protein [Marinobacter sp.]|uniref:DUF4124 domain-containing protein n=1 Tax=Marinobacter sp. TaxID=50741 RepID=UPI002D7F8582|nr:DUF4124 domain-containing protein [Marinobacter sp.]HET8799616.1 DUF4124 domain-containing protein [Marinobacter sp.]
MLKEVIISTVLLLALSVNASAAVYKCTVDGQAVFSDEPCGEDAKKLDHEPAPLIGGQFDTGTNIEFYEPEEQSNESASDPCPYINSTRMRRLQIQNKITRGMKPTDVRRSWGSPSSISTGGSSTQWAYHYPGGSANYVYFAHGCVSDWSGYYRTH